MNNDGGFKKTFSDVKAFIKEVEPAEWDMGLFYAAKELNTYYARAKVPFDWKEAVKENKSKKIIRKLKKSYKKFDASFGELLTQIEAHFIKLRYNINKYSDFIYREVRNHGLTDELKKLMKKFGITGNSIAALIRRLEELVERVENSCMKGLRRMFASLKRYSSFASKKSSKLFRKVKNSHIYNLLFGKMKGITGRVFGKITQGLDLIIGCTETLVGAMTGNTKLIFQGIYDIIIGVVLLVLAIKFGLLIGIIAAVLIMIIELFYDDGGSIIHEIWDFMVSTVKQVLDGIINVYNQLSVFFTDKLTAIKETLVNIIREITQQIIPEIIDSVMDMLSNFISGIIDKFVNYMRYSIEYDKQFNDRLSGITIRSGFSENHISTLTMQQMLLLERSKK